MASSSPWFRCVRDANQIAFTHADRSFSKLGVASIRVACGRRRRPDRGKRNTERNNRCALGADTCSRLANCCNFSRRAGVTCHSKAPAPFPTFGRVKQRRSFALSPCPQMGPSARLGEGQFTHRASVSTLCHMGRDRATRSRYSGGRPLIWQRKR